MKYNENNPPLVCMQTQSTCYNGTYPMQILGVLWHSTGANNPNLSRYVQPSDNASDREAMLKLLGTNGYGNDWNHITTYAGLNAWIGELADGTVATVQSMPWNYAPWGCGAGYKGSCNGGWIQFEICEDSLADESYFNEAYKEACELTAYLCVKYGLDPLGKVSYKGVSVPVILCHQDSYRLGLGGNHGDIYHWFTRYGKDMDDVRRDVAEIINNSKEEAMTSEERKEFDDLKEDVKELREKVDEITKVYKYWKELPKWALRPMYAAYKAKLFAGASPSNLNVTMDMIRTVVMDARLARLDGKITFKDDVEGETKEDILKELGIE